MLPLHPEARHQPVVVLPDEGAVVVVLSGLMAGCDSLARHGLTEGEAVRDLNHFQAELCGVHINKVKLDVTLPDLVYPGVGSVLPGVVGWIEVQDDVVKIKVCRVRTCLKVNLDGVGADHLVVDVDTDVPVGPVRGGDVLVE